MLVLGFAGLFKLIVVLSEVPDFTVFGNAAAKAVIVIFGEGLDDLVALVLSG